MANRNAQDYLREAGEVARSSLPAEATLSDAHVAKLKALRTYELELEAQAKALREAIDYEVTDALTNGLSFTEVANPLELSKQRIAQRYAKDKEGRSIQASEFLRQVLNKR